MIIFTFVTLMSGKQLTSASYQRTLAFDTLTDHRTVSNKKTPLLRAQLRQNLYVTQMYDI